MGLASSIEAAAKVRGTPKLALVSPPPSEKALRTPPNGDELSIQVLAFSMGKPHPSLQLTGAACLASAVCIEGTVAHGMASHSDVHSLKSDALLDALSNGFKITERSLSPASDSCDTTSPASPASPANGQMSEVSTPDSVLQAQKRTVRIHHASGAIDVGVVAACSEEWAVVERCSVSRTARRLFDGTVYYYQ
jgi:2-methylaconitate cis-trans-isomerase PrpF